MYNTTGCCCAQSLWAFPKAGSQDGAASDSCAWTNVCVLFPQLLPWPQTGAQDPSRPRCGYPQKCAQSGISPSITRPFWGCFPATISVWKPGSACCKKLIIIPHRDAAHHRPPTSDATCNTFRGTPIPTRVRAVRTHMPVATQLRQLK